MANLPQDCANYITQELGRKLNEIVAHRYVGGEEPKYAVLMKEGAGYSTVIFVGRYSARRPLGDYEEAYVGNALQHGWECLSDGDEWEHTVGKFKNANASFF